MNNNWRPNSYLWMYKVCIFLMGLLHGVQENFQIYLLLVIQECPANRSDCTYTLASLMGSPTGRPQGIGCSREFGGKHDFPLTPCTCVFVRRADYVICLVHKVFIFFFWAPFKTHVDKMIIFFTSSIWYLWEIVQIHILMHNQFLKLKLILSFLWNIFFFVNMFFCKWCSLNIVFFRRF